MRLKNLRMQNSKWIVVAVILNLAIVLTMPSTVFSQNSSATYTVYVGGDLPHPGGESMYMGFNPSVMVTHAGDTIVWKALDGPHTVTSENQTAGGAPLFDSNPKVSFPLPQVVFGPGGHLQLRFQQSWNLPVLL